MKVVFILSDALRHDYIEYMPFLKKMSMENNYYEKVIPGLGFCEISEYVSGYSSLQNGNIFQLTFNGKFGKQIFNREAKLNNFFNHIPRVRRYTQKYFDNFVLENKTRFVDPDVLQIRYNIPINLLNYFQPTESRIEYDSDSFFPNSNIFRLLKDKKITYDIKDFVKHNKIKGTDEDRIFRLKEKIRTKSLEEFTLLYIGKGEYAHLIGTKDQKLQTKLREYDYELSVIKKMLDDNYAGKYRFIILGDHGMVDVEKYIDLTPLIKKIEHETKMILGEDYIYFIDSTAFRLWFEKKTYKDKCDLIIKDYLNSDIDNIKIENEFYGDLIYLLKPGIVFFPDFFNTKKNKGMHGYTNEVDDQKGLCVVIGTHEHKKVPELQLHDVKNLVMEQYK